MLDDDKLVVVRRGGLGKRRFLGRVTLMVAWSDDLWQSKLSCLCLLRKALMMAA